MTENASYQSTKHQPKLFYGYIVVIIAFIVMVLAYGVRSSFGVFFKPMLTDFEWTRALTSGAVTLSLLVQGLWGIVMGRVNDRIGSRWVITLCCFLLGLGLLLMSAINGAWQLYLFYGLVFGMGMGGVFVALISTAARWFIKKRGLMTGIVLAGIGGGTLAVAPLANWLIYNYGWRSSYIIIGSLVLILGIVAAQFLRRDPAKMALVPYGYIQGKEQKLSADTEGLSLKEAVGTRQFWMAAISFACLGYALFTITIHLVPHITDLGISASTAATIFSIGGGVQSVGGIVLGVAADRLGIRSIIAISFVLVAATLFWLVPITTVLMFYLFSIIINFGFGGATAMESTIVAELFGLKSHGVILGVVSFAFTVGAAIGPLVTGYLFDLTGNYQIAFLTCAALAVVGLVLTATLRPSEIRAIKH